MNPNGWMLIPIKPKSKNPGSIVGAGWPAKASSDPSVINEWIESNPGCNFGVLLGPKSGIIDVEYDSDEGREILEPIIGSCRTPTYRSAKSIHRLFLYEERFSLEKAKVGIKGTEWRFGHDTAQSVIPPSIHETGISYEWLDGLSPGDCDVSRLPDEAWILFENLKAEHEKQVLIANDTAKKYVDGDGLIDVARNFVEKNYTWNAILSGSGWTFKRNRKDASDWYRPGKKSGMISGTVGFGGTSNLRVFSTSCDPLKADCSYDKFAFLCVTKYADDPIDAANNLLPKEILEERRKAWMNAKNNTSGVNIDSIMKKVEGEIFDDEEICERHIPKTGLLKEVFDFYMGTTRRPSNIIGLAVAVSLCEGIFGRKVRSYTDMRTQDYTIIVAPTNCGKESCIKTIQKLIYGAMPTTKFLIPSNVQSGNGLLAAVAESPSCLWMCDEFGTFLEGAINKKFASKHTKEIVDHLLQMYTRADGRYQGAAHAAGKRNEIEQPSLTLLGITTGSTLFENIDRKQIESGLFGRCSFWTVQTRPQLSRSKIVAPKPELLESIAWWMNYSPGGINSSYFPEPPIVKFSDDATKRWENHEEQIDESMCDESEIRAAIWGRVAGRSMKLALVHRCARLGVDPSSANWDFIYVEREDIDWGISVSNWLARSACELAESKVGDFTSIESSNSLERILKRSSGEWVSRSSILRACRNLTSGDIGAAAKKLPESIETRTIKKDGKGRPETQYRWIQN